MRRKCDYMIVSLLGASGLFLIFYICILAAGCGETAWTDGAGTDSYIQGTETGLDTQEIGQYAETGFDAQETRAAAETLDAQETGENEETPEEPLDGPPALEISYVVEDEEESSITVTSGNGSWNIREDEGTMSSNVYCGVHPLDMNYEAATIALDPEQSTHVLKLQFGVKPDYWEVTAMWNGEDAGNADAYDNGMAYSVTADFKDDCYMAALEGDYIYEIKAVWDREDYGGEAYYCFQTVVEK